MIGAVGGIIVVFAVPLLDKLRIDDVVGAIPVHLLAGIWGTLAVPITNGETSFATQILGIAAIGVFVSAVSLVLWLVLKATLGIRIGDEEELVQRSARRLRCTGRGGPHGGPLLLGSWQMPVGEG